MKVSIVGSLRDQEVACSASDRQGSNFESCVWRTVSSQSSHHPQEVLLAQFSLYVHKGGLKPDSFHFISWVGILCSSKTMLFVTEPWRCWHGSKTMLKDAMSSAVFRCKSYRKNLDEKGRMRGQTNHKKLKQLYSEILK